MAVPASSRSGHCWATFGTETRVRSTGAPEHRSTGASEHLLQLLGAGSLYTLLARDGASTIQCRYGTWKAAHCIRATSQCVQISSSHMCLASVKWPDSVTARHLAALLEPCWAVFVFIRRDIISISLSMLEPEPA
ncbi:hypothetical protein E4U41_003334 [Claviceps citrina]|nr:hypothetical protein E4U41_003334 [Claviceps citrina]